MPSIFNHLNSTNLTDFHIKKPDDDFYPSAVQDILTFCGNEYETTDFHSAIQYLNQILKLSLNNREEKVLGLLFTGLSQAFRFGGSIYIQPQLGENSAVHSCHSAILATEMFRRAGLLENESDEVSEMRVVISMALLVHDMGEILGELSSVDQRSRNAALKEEPEIERRIFEIALRYAYSGVESGRSCDFYKNLKNLRNKVEARSKEIGFCDALREVTEECVAPKLSDSSEKAMKELFLEPYELSEIHDVKVLDKSSLFIGYVAKAIERMQGTRHLTRFCTKDETYVRLHLFSPHSSPANSPTVATDSYSSEKELTVPLSWADSARLRSSSRYLEEDLGYMFKYAQSDIDRKLARTVCSAVYLTQVELLNASSPFIDRISNESDETVTLLSDMILDKNSSFEERKANSTALKHYLQVKRRRLREEFCTQWDLSSFEDRPAFLEIESKPRLMALYLHAAKIGYEPKPGEVLLLHKELPQELRDYHLNT